MNTLTRWLAIPLSRIPLVKYWLYPARIIIRKKPVSENQGIETAWLPFRYGVMPDGSEVSLGCTVDTARDVAERIYAFHLKRAGVEWLAPIRTEGSDFHPLDSKSPMFSHFPARTWREKRAMWHQYLGCKYVQSGNIRTAFQPTMEGRNRG